MLYSDINEKKATSLQIEKFNNDDDKIANEENEPKSSDMEIACQEESHQGNVEEGSKETSDEYHHSLWKWPSGRCKLTKVAINFVLTVSL